MELFWEHGFEGVSISDLTDATGINRRSLYAAFGTKEELFRCAVRRYLDGPSGFVAAALQQPRAREVAEAMLHGAADSYTDPARPRGCLVVHGALAAGGDTDNVRVDLARQRDAGVKALATGSTKRRPRGNCRAWTRSCWLAGSTRSAKAFRCRHAAARPAMSFIRRPIKRCGAGRRARERHQMTLSEIALALRVTA